MISEPPIVPRDLSDTVRRALAEDLGTGDVTTLSVVSADAAASAVLLARAPGVIAGLPVVEEVFRQVDPSVAVNRRILEGSAVRVDEIVADVTGPARGILMGERVALNFLQRLSGIATLTAAFVERISGTRARIVDTRKTTPGLRALEKYAVRAGGGRNHRMGLYDAVMIKDNHIVAAGGIRNAVRRARESAPHTMTVTVECESLAQVEEALAAGADALLLDNMTSEMRRQAVALVNGRAVTEASGGVTLDTVAAIARTGVDIISVGALTHSAPALDISLDIREMSESAA